MTLLAPLVAGDRAPRQAGEGIAIQSLVLVPLASLPVDPVEGQMARLAADGFVYQYVGGIWSLSGGGGAAGSGTTYLASYGDATPALVFSLPANQAIDNIDIEVTEVWDGPGATIRLGTLAQPGKYFDSTDTELLDLNVFAKAFAELGPVQIYITINPGSSPTKGKVRVQISTTTAGT